jgi:hypothetical protein
LLFMGCTTNAVYADSMAIQTVPKAAKGMNQLRRPK